MTTNDDIIHALGRLEGKMDSVQTTLEDHSQRLRTVEARSLRNGLISGAVMSLATTLAAFGLKSHLEI